MDPTKRRATIALLLLSPMTAEMLSGSTPPLLFFNPIAFLLFISFYGCGAILARELIVRWNKSKASLLLVGAAYGVWEEGIAVKSFFDPNWVDLGILGSFGRWLGVNWIWAFELTVYHAVISITIPVVLVELLFPSIRGEELLGKKGKAIASISFIVSTFILNRFLTSFQMGLEYYLLCLFLIVVFIYAAYRLPSDIGRGDVELPSPRRLLLFGFIWVTTWFAIFWIGPHIVKSPVIIALLGALQLYLTYRYLSKFNWEFATDKHYVGIIFGILLWHIILAPIIEIAHPNPAENPAGMTLVGLAYLIFMIKLWRKHG